MSVEQDTMRRRRIIALAALLMLLLASGGIYLWLREPLRRFLERPEVFRNWVQANGFWSRLAMMGMMAIQVIIAFIPGEPFEIVAGYSFGAVEGTILCLAGALAGSVVVFLLVKRHGMRVVTLFFTREQIESVRFLQDSKRVNVLTFVLFLIPGTPKDIMTYLVGLTPMKLSTWMVIVSIARIPSVVTSTISGDALGLKEYRLAIIIFALTLAASGVGLLIYRRFCEKKSAASPGGDGDSPSDQP